MHALSASKLISIFSLSVVLLHGMSEADKQTASKGRKEAPPFLEITDRQVPSEAQRPTNESIAPLDNPLRDAEKLQQQQPLEKKHLNDDNETSEVPAQSSSNRKMPFFFIFNVPRLTSDQDPDYGWSIWSDWTPCSTKCRVQSRHFRVRHCELSPADVGASCVGEDTQWKTCDLVPCAGSAKQGSSSSSSGEAEEAAKENADWKIPKHDGVSRPPGIDPVQTASWNREEEEEENVSWQRCRTPCPFEIYLRERWCFVGMYCVGERKEARVCTQRFGLLVCSDVDLASFDPTSDTNSDGRQAIDGPSVRPWVDSRIGWSSWTPWTICSDADCLYHVQELNASRRPCPQADTGGGGGGGRAADCAVDGGGGGGEPKELRICRGGVGGGEEFEFESSIICGPIGELSTWKVAEDFKPRKALSSSSSYSGRIVHGIVVVLLFGPLVILVFYWLVTRSRRPRYESLPSATNSVYVSTPQPTISTDASSAVGPNYVLVEENQKTWKTV